ncbi:MAG: cob(I)yrinic acid a,c-diamide adenosyltransferase, partial [Caldisphaera sp.]|nr:cob(I)yrinic acid a,c-diamide adenosyltransferase [Caldisphaera sp.]
TLDEANSFIGLARSFLPNYFTDFAKELKEIQYLTFRLGFHVSGSKSLSENDVKYLEELADKYYGKAPLKNFILPAGPSVSSALHVARTVIRRAERSLISASDTFKFDDIVYRVINRLSSTLFAMAIYISRQMGYQDEAVTFR